MKTIEINNVSYDVIRENASLPCCKPGEAVIYVKLPRGTRTYAAKRVWTPSGKPQIVMLTK